MFAIFGSGFGLYGYLPALLQEGESVTLLQRYRRQFESRPELAQFTGQIHWAHDEDDALAKTDAAVIARRPADQLGVVFRCCERPQIRRMVLEKPLAPTPELAASVGKRITDAGKSYRVGYIFRFTPWGEKLLRERDASGGPVEIRWRFMARHIAQRRDSWKQIHSQGGGALRFYGIHLIALLAELGYRAVEHSQASGQKADEFDKWSASFAGPGLPNCTVLVDCNSTQSEFSIRRNKQDSYVRAAGPFEPVIGTSGLDPRVPMLVQLYRSFSEHTTPPWYGSVIALWSEAERHTEISGIR